MVFQKKWATKAFPLILIFISALVALAIRWPHFFWDAALGQIEEEARHTYSAMSGPLWIDLMRNVVGQTQPILEYALRKFFWLPILGIDERAPRLISLLYGLGSIALSAQILSTILIEKYSFRRWSAGFATFLGLSWILLSEQHIFYSVMARHYSFLLFISAAFSYLYFLRGGLERASTRWISFIFINSHFFALIPVGVAFAVRFFTLRGFSARLRLSLEVFLGLLATIALNYRALSLLVFSPPSGQEKLSAFAAAVAAARDYFRFWESDTGLGFLAALVFFSVVAIGGFRKKNFHFVLLLLGPVLFATFWLLRKSSGYVVEPRYLFVFWGFIPVLVGEFMGSASQKAEELSPRSLGRFRSVLCLLPLLLFTKPLFNSSVTFDRNSFRLPPRMFTRYAEAYQWVKERVGDEAVLLLSDTCYTHETPMLYLRYFPDPHLGALFLEDTFGCLGHPMTESREQIDTVLRLYPGAIVVFDSRGIDCGGLAKRAGSPSGDGERIDVGIACMQVFRGIRDFNGIKEAALKTGFRHHPDFF